MREVHCAMEKVRPEDCEALNVSVPKQVFRSRATWLLTEATKSSLIRFLLTTVLIGTCSLFSVDEVYFFPVAVTTLVLAFLMIPFDLYHLWMSNRAVSKNRSKLAQLVNKINPGMDLRKWDEVTYEMNEFLYQKGLWKTPHCIFSREFCQAYFRRYLVTPFLKEKSAGTESNDDASEKDCEKLSVESYQHAVRKHFDGLLKGNMLVPQGEYQVHPTKRSNIALRLKNFCLRKGLLMLGLHLCLIGSTIPGFIKSKNPCFLLAQIFFLFADALTGFNALDKKKFYKLGLSERLWFLATIVEVSPGSSMEKYNEVARYMNHHINSENPGEHSEAFFIDGKDCISFVREQLAPLAFNKVGTAGAPYCELTDIVAEAMTHVDLDLK